MMDSDLGDANGLCEVVIPSTGKSSMGQTRNNETQTKAQKTKTVEVQTAEMVSQGCQAGNVFDKKNVIELASVQDSVAAFLQTILPRVEAQLTSDSSSKIFEDYGVSWEETREEISTHLKLSHKHFDGKKEKKLTKASGIAWNSSGTVLAAGYGRSDHSGWCEHQGSLCFWNVMRRQLDNKKADIAIMLPCCVMSIAFHPSQPTIIAGGLYNGEIRVWDIANEEEPLLMSSKIDDLFHREPVSDIIWVRDYLDSGRGYNIVSSSTDGKVLTWSPKNKLAYPRSGCVLIPTKTYYGHGNVANRYPTLGATSVAFSIDASNFVIGTEGGGLVKSLQHSKLLKRKGYVKSGEWRYSVEAARILENVADVNRYEVKRHIERFVNERDGKKVVEVDDIFAARPKATNLYPNGGKFAFEPHSGPVYKVAFSPFHRNIFLSCSTDGTIRVYNMLRKEPLIYLEPTEGYLFDVAWSTGRPLVFAAADGKGNIYVYDLLKDMLSPVHTFQVDKHSNKVTAICFNPADPSLLSSCDIAGKLITWQLGSELSSLQPTETAVLEKMGRQ